MKGRIVSFLCCFVLLSLTVVGKEKDRVQAELRDKAISLFESEKYLEAAPLLSQLLSLNQGDTLLNYYYGVSIVSSPRQRQNAIAFLEFARKSKSTPSDVWFYLGRAQMSAGKFTQAISSFYSYLEAGGSVHEKRDDAKKFISNCENAELLLKDRKVMAVLNEREIPEANFYTAYQFEEGNGKIVKAAPQFTVSADRQDGVEPVMYMSADLRTVYVSSHKRIGGGKDLFRVLRLGDGSWSSMVAAGDEIRSPLDEDYAFLDKNGRTLYFSSKGFNSIGGYDIFRSDYDYGSGQWSAPVNLGIPFNSTDDDMMFVPSSDGKTATYVTAEKSDPGKLTLRTVELADDGQQLATIKGFYKSIDQKMRRDARVSVVRMSDHAVISSVRTDPRTGQYELAVKPEETYLLVVDGGGYVPHAETFTIPAGVDLSNLKQVVAMNRAGNSEDLKLTNYFNPMMLAGGANESTSESTQSVDVTRIDSTRLISIRIDNASLMVLAPSANLVTELKGPALVKSQEPAKDIAAVDSTAVAVLDETAKKAETDQRMVQEEETEEVSGPALSMRDQARLKQEEAEEYRAAASDLRADAAEMREQAASNDNLAATLFDELERMDSADAERIASLQKKAQEFSDRSAATKARAADLDRKAAINDALAVKADMESERILKGGADIVYRDETAPVALNSAQSREDAKVDPVVTTNTTTQPMGGTEMSQDNSTQSRQDAKIDPVVTANTATQPMGGAEMAQDNSVQSRQDAKVAADVTTNTATQPLGGKEVAQDNSAQSRQDAKGTEQLVNSEKITQSKGDAEQAKDNGAQSRQGAKGAEQLVNSEKITQSKGDAEQAQDNSVQSRQDAKGAEQLVNSEKITQSKGDAEQAKDNSVQSRQDAKVAADVTTKTATQPLGGKEVAQDNSAQNRQDANGDPVVTATNTTQSKGDAELAQDNSAQSREDAKVDPVAQQTALIENNNQPAGDAEVVKMNGVQNRGGATGEEDKLRDVQNVLPGTARTYLDTTDLTLLEKQAQAPGAQISLSAKAATSGGGQTLSQSKGDDLVVQQQNVQRLEDAKGNIIGAQSRQDVKGNIIGARSRQDAKGNNTSAQSHEDAKFDSDVTNNTTTQPMGGTVMAQDISAQSRQDAKGTPAGDLSLATGNVAQNTAVGEVAQQNSLQSREEAKGNNISAQSCEDAKDDSDVTNNTTTQPMGGTVMAQDISAQSREDAKGSRVVTTNTTTQTKGDAEVAQDNSAQSRQDAKIVPVAGAEATNRLKDETVRVKFEDGTTDDSFEKSSNSTGNLKVDEASRAISARENSQPLNEDLAAGDISAEQDPAVDAPLSEREVISKEQEAELDELSNEDPLAALDHYQEFQTATEQHEQLIRQAEALEEDLDDYLYGSERDSMVALINELGMESIRQWQYAQLQLRAARNADPSIESMAKDPDFLRSNGLMASTDNLTGSSDDLEASRQNRTVSHPDSTADAVDNVGAVEQENNGVVDTGDHTEAGSSASIGRESQANSVQQSTDEGQIAADVQPGPAEQNNELLQQVDTSLAGLEKEIVLSDTAANRQYHELRLKIESGQKRTVDLFTEGVQLNNQSTRNRERQVSLMLESERTSEASRRKELESQAEGFRKISEETGNMARDRFAEARLLTDNIRIMTEQAAELRTKFSESLAVQNNTQSREDANGSHVVTINNTMQSNGGAEAAQDNSAQSREDAKGAPISTANNTTQSNGGAEVAQDNSAQSREDAKGAPIVTANNTTQSNGGAEVAQDNNAQSREDANGAPIVTANNTTQSKGGAEVAQNNSAQSREDASGISSTDQGRQANQSKSRLVAKDTSVMDGLMFLVRIGSFKSEVPDSAFGSMTMVRHTISPDGLHNYTIGSFRSFTAANLVKKEFQSIGFTTASVNAFYAGAPVELSEAASILNENGEEEKAMLADIEQEELVRLRAAEIYPGRYIAGIDREESEFNNEPVSLKGPAKFAATEAAGVPQQESRDIVNHSAEVSVVNNTAESGNAETVKYEKPAIERQAPVVLEHIVSNAAVRYTVQVGVYRSSVPPVRIATLPTLRAEQLREDVYRYSTGIFDSRQQADSMRRIVAAMGMKDAFVTILRGGNAIVLLGNHSSGNGVAAPSDKAVHTAHQDGEISYRIQLGAFRGKIPYSAVQAFVRVFEQGIDRKTNEAGYQVFYSGNYLSYQEAVTARDEAIGKGVKDAFIVALKDGKRLSIDQAIRQERH